jgi:hypothetical protein
MKKGDPMARKNIAFCTVFALAMTATAAVADDHAPAAQDISARKTEITARIDERITALQKDKSCVENAADQAALKGCRQEFVAERKAHRESRKGHRKFRQGSSNDN